MPIDFKPFDAAEFLTTPNRVAFFLEAVFEDGDEAEIKQALGVVARAKGMTKIAEATGLTREALYKALQADGDPKLSTFLAVMRALGMRIVARPAKAKAKASRRKASAADDTTGDTRSADTAAQTPPRRKTAARKPRQKAA